MITAPLHSQPSLFSRAARYAALGVIYAFAAVVTLVFGLFAFLLGFFTQLLLRRSLPSFVPPLLASIATVLPWLYFGQLTTSTDGSAQLLLSLFIVTVLAASFSVTGAAFCRSLIDRRASTLADEHEA